MTTTTTTQQPRTPGSGSSPTSTTVPAGGTDYEGVASGATDLADRLAVFRMQVAQGGSPDLSTIDQATVVERPGYNDDPRRQSRRGGSRRRTIGSLLGEMSGWSDAEVREMQRLLYEAGYYPASYYEGTDELSGISDADTRAAYALLLSDAVLQDGKPIEDILANRREDFAATGRLARGGKVKPGQFSAGQAHTIQLDSEESLAQMIDDVAVELYGQNADPALKAKLVSRLRGQDKASQQRLIDADEAMRRTNFDAAVAQDDADEAGGTLPNPVAGGKFGQTIGAQRQGHLHEGVDIMAPMGAPVTAAASGTVRFVRTGGTGGLRVEVQGDDGRVYRYMHLSAAQWDVGQGEGTRVEAGQAIGAVGDSGNAKGSGPHLHFEVRENGQPLDPYKLIATGDTAAGADVYVPSTTTTTEVFDPRAETEAALKEADPATYGAHQVAGQYQSFRRFLGRSV